MAALATVRLMEEPGHLKRAVIDTTAGAISGAISRTATSPLDVIKIQFQVQLEPTSSWALHHKDVYRPSKYTGMLQATKDIFREEGLRVIGIDLLSQSLLPAIVELAEDRHWRVRLAIIEYIPLLASQLGVGFFDDKLGALCMQWLQDKVYSIRDAAANNLKRLAEEFGPEWAMQHIIPQVLEMITNPHYLYWMTILRAISLLAPVMGPEITCSKLLPVITTAAKDRVPNIKFNVAKVLQSLISIVDQSVVEKTIRPSLVELAEDPDVDVRFFANQALQSIDNVMMSS